jgi:hypothetical protein
MDLLKRQFVFKVDKKKLAADVKTINLELIL